MVFVTAKHALLLFTIITHCVHQANASQCLKSILRSNLTRTWQSSSFRSSSGEKYCGLGNPETQFYFHSGFGLAAADNGYHWLIMLIPSTIWLNRLYITHGEVDNISYTSHAQNIEIWITQSNVDFGSNSCESKTISSIFDGDKYKWRFCGKTGNRNSGWFFVDCGGLTKMVAFRKSITEGANKLDHYMSFRDMLWNVSLSVEIEPRSIIRKNETVTLRCASKCLNIDKSRIKLTRPSRNQTLATANQVYVINHVNESHAGEYTCRIDDDVAVSTRSLVIESPPAELKIDYQMNLCAGRSPTLAFESSAAEPEPTHFCRAIDLGLELIRKEYSLSDSKQSSIRSFWSCKTCGAVANLTVNCTAASSGLNDHELWSVSIVKSLHLNREFCFYEYPNKSHAIALASTVLILAAVAIISVAFATITMIKNKRRLRYSPTEQASSELAAGSLE